ncbi:hypothetical protein VNO77_22762 [Canavalia gladiata]|uniref:Uncharacterized protein n=1 Tax=Canavalia gladiata TaxID=3824 RepID=A0AAN9L6H1_CANGL
MRCTMKLFLQAMQSLIDGSRICLLVMTHRQLCSGKYPSNESPPSAVVVSALLGIDPFSLQSCDKDEMKKEFRKLWVAFQDSTIYTYCSAMKVRYTSTTDPSFSSDVHIGRGMRVVLTQI